MLGDVLGLASEEALAYRELISIPSTTPSELAARVGVSAADAARLLAALEQNGLAARSGGDNSRFVAAPPTLALGALLVKRQNEIRLAELELGSLDEIYRSAAAERSIVDVVDVVRGPDAVRQRFEQLQLGAREEVMAFVKPQVAVVSAAENTAEDQAVARGVRYRIVLERAAVDGPDAYDELARAAEAGEEIRIADSVPLKLVVIDRELAYLPMASSSGPAGVGALLVHESGLLDALLALFESVWSTANPLVVSAGEVSELAAEVIDDADARILGLLLAGLTDQAVSNQLQMSLRTVQRRVRHLMDLAKVETRMQLGWQAAKLGWL